MEDKNSAFIHDVQGHQFTFIPKVQLFHNKKTQDIHIEYDIYIDGTYCITLCARELLLPDQESLFRFKVANRILKHRHKSHMKQNTRLSNNTSTFIKQPLFEKKKVMFNTIKTIHAHTGTYEVPLINKPDDTCSSVASNRIFS